MRKINYHPGLVIFLTIFVSSCCVQASLAQSSSVLKEVSFKQITQLVSEPQAGNLLNADDLAFRKVSNFPASSSANMTRYFKDGKYNVNVISKSYSTFSFAGKNLSNFVLR
jgi:hypothetical protein